jgi:hypothetical protein
MKLGTLMSLFHLSNRKMLPNAAVTSPRRPRSASSASDEMEPLVTDLLADRVSSLDPPLVACDGDNFGNEMTLDEVE